MQRTVGRAHDGCEVLWRRRELQCELAHIGEGASAGTVHGPHEEDISPCAKEPRERRGVDQRVGGGNDEPIWHSDAVTGDIAQR